MEDVLTTVLDMLALLLVAFGAGALAYPWLGWGAAVISGLVLFAGARAAEMLEARRGRSVRR